MKKRTFLTALFLILLHLTYSQNPYANFEWAVKAGGTDYDYPTSIATDQQGNSYVTGYFRGTSTFGNTTLTASVFEDYFVAKLNPQGQFLWAVKAEVTEASQDYSNAIAVDNQGNCYVTGNFRGSVTFGNTTMTTATDATDGFVAKIDAQGQFVWSVQMTGEAYNWTVAKSITVDDQGNSYIAGIFYEFSTITFGTTTLTGSADRNGFFTKLNAQGQFLWAVKAEGIDAGNQFAIGIAVDAEGNSYATGMFYETATFGTIAVAGSGFDIFITKLNPQGEYLWAVNAGGSDNNNDRGNGIAVDDQGNSYITGEFSGTAAFGNFSLTSSGQRDIFVAKLDPQGQFIWATPAGGAGYDEGHEIVVDALGNSYVIGVSSSGTAVFGNSTLTISGATEGYIAKLNPQGQFVAAAKVDENNIMSIDLDGQGVGYITGWLGGPSTFGSTTLTQSGGGDIYVAKLSESLVGLSEEKYTHLSVLPNPGNGIYTILTETAADRKAINVHSVSGQLVLQVFMSGEHTTIDLSDQPNGMYLLSVNSPDAVYNYKLIKQ